MSVFDYPRINVKGLIRLDPGTGNNDDYAATATFQGEPVGLLESKTVTARTYGMDDATFLPWAQVAHPFDVVSQPGTTKDIIPAEWNFYGDMSMKEYSITCVGADAGSATVVVANCLNAEFSISGAFTDINPEGSPPATQFFIKKIALGPKDDPLISAELSKGTGQWINFYRNVNLTADAGAGASVYHAIPDATVNLLGWNTLQGVNGIVFRYYLSRALLENPDTGTTNEQIEELYKNGDNNPKLLELVGTITPLYDTETHVAMQTGRLLTMDTPNVTTPTNNNNGNGTVALGPAILNIDNNTGILRADFVGTFPDNYDSGDGSNPKYDFGTVYLVAEHKDGGQLWEFPVSYADTAQGDANGWLFDFDISAIQSLLPDVIFKLVSDNFGEVLTELDYYFVSNQLAIYGEQNGDNQNFLNNGTTEQATISVFHRGEELATANCPDITVWQYASTPIEAPGDAIPISTNFKPGDPLVVDVSQPGNLLFTFTVTGDGNTPPTNYGAFSGPPYITNWPQISLRILPNEDYDQYFVDPGASEPVGNNLLTFDVLYDNVLRVYYLLYPVMHPFLPLNDEQIVASQAPEILIRTDPAPENWLAKTYMPMTRDLSNSRRRLLQAWCRKMILREKQKGRGDKGGRVGRPA